MKQLLKSNFYIRLTNWEYWPFGIIQFPFFIYWLWLSLRAKSLLFFSAANPTITMGGMFAESKYDVLKLIPDQYKPLTIKVSHKATIESVLRVMNESNLSFPVIFKPDIGERGFMVKRIANEREAAQYLTTIRQDFLIQELVDLPVECGVFYTRFPNEPTGRVTSLTLKEMLSVIGDGESSLRTLIINKPRAKLQLRKLEISFGDQMSMVIPKGIEIVLNTIGNHCLGTKFINGEEYINGKLHATFDQISKQIEGFYFGRYDLRCASIEDLYEGKIRIVELNGCGAEPAHIYQPGYSLRKALGVMYHHWKNLFTISMQNHKRGVKFMSSKEGWKLYKEFTKAVQ